MKKTTFVIAMFLVVSTSMFAQTLNDALKLTTNEQFEKADALFQTLLQSQPNNGEILFYYGENFFINDQYEKAKEQYQKAVDLNATNPFGYVGLGKIQWNLGKQAEAKANFFKATTLAAGKSAAVLMKIAEVYTNAEIKNLAEATALLAQAAKLEPKNPEVYILTGDVFLEQNDGTKAIQNYEKASVLDPKSVLAILRQGQVWNRAKNYNLALDTYKKASLIDSTYAPAYREKAEIYFRAGQYANAVAQYKRYLQLNNNCTANSRYAGFLNRAKQYKEAIIAAQEAQKCDPHNLYLLRYLAFSQYEVGDYPNGLLNSEMFFAKATPETKAIPLDYEYHAKLLSKNGKDSLAIIDYKKVFDADTTRADLYYEIGNAYLKMKKYADAIIYFQKKIDSGKPTINDYFGLCRAYYQSKDFINADSAAAQMIRALPENPTGYLWRAKSNTQLDPKNEKWQAKQWYELYISKLKPEELLLPSNKNNLIEAYTYLGVYSINHKDIFCSAKDYFKKVIELDPANSNAKKFLDSAEAKKCP